MFGGKLVKDFNQGREMIGFEFLNSVLIKDMEPIGRWPEMKW